MPLAAVAGIGAAGSLISGIMGSNAAGNAASAQAQAANNAAQLQYQASQNSLGFQEQQYNQNQKNLQPWLQSGAGAMSNLDYLLGITPQGTGQSSAAPQGLQQPGTTTVNPQTGAPQLNSKAASSAAPNGLSMPNASGVSGSTASTPASFAASPSSSSPGGFGSLLQPYGQTFSAPTSLTEQNDPGYQARLKLGTDAIQRSAAAAGGVVTGGTAQALDQYGQDYASNEYNNVYNRALSTYGTNYNQFENQQANEYNRLAGISGVGQTAATTLGNQGQSAANAVTSNLTGTASAIGQDVQNAGAANASGYVGSSNAWNGALNGISGTASQLSLLQQLGTGSGYGGGSTSDPYGLNSGYLGGQF